MTTINNVRQRFYGTFYGVVVGVVVCAGMGWWATRPTSVDPVTANDGVVELVQESKSAAEPSNSIPVDNSITTDTNAENLPLITQAKQYRLNLVDMFDTVRNRCLPEWGREECNIQTRNFLRDRTPDNGKDELLAVYDQFIQYEDYIAINRPTQNQDLEDLYQSLQQLRTRFFEPDVRAWLFGPEDARMAYEFALRDFMDHDAVRLPPLERLQRLEQLRQTKLGEFYALFVSRENSVDYYQLQLDVLSLESPPSAETSHYVELIQEKLHAVRRP